MNFLTKIAFSLKKPKIIVVAGKERVSAGESILRVLEKEKKARKATTDTLPLDFKEKDVFLFEADFDNPRILEDFKFLVRNSLNPILVLTGINGAGEKKAIEELLENMPDGGRLVLNFEDSKEIVRKGSLKELIFGFEEGADILASDIKINDETNFKINYKGNSVPMWLKKDSGEKEVFAALTAAAVGLVADMNLVEISEALKP